MILFLEPGLEDSWKDLSAVQKTALMELLPSTPGPTRLSGSASLCRVAVADANDPLLEGLTDERFQLNAITIRGLVPLAAEGSASTVLNAVPADPTPGSCMQGFLYRKPIVRGVCFTFATPPKFVTPIWRLIRRFFRYWCEWRYPPPVS